MRSTERGIVGMILGVFLLAGQAVAQEKAFDPSVLSAEGNQGYQALLKVDTFAIGGIGYAGSTSVGEKSLDVLIGEDRAVSVLKRLIDTATPEGGLYAVLGLKTLKCDCLDTEVKRFNARTFSERKRSGRGVVASEDVSTMTGCLGFMEKRLDVLDRILTGEYDHWINFRTVNRWSKEKG